MLKLKQLIGYDPKYKTYFGHSNTILINKNNIKKVEYIEYLRSGLFEAKIIDVLIVTLQNNEVIYAEGKLEDLI